MAAKALNVKMDENRLLNLKNVAAVFHMTMTEVINEALDAYLSMMMKDPFYRLTVNVEDAEAEECAEILNALGALTDDDLSIASKKQCVVR